MRKLKFSEFEQIVQGYSLTSHAVQCQNSCCCYFTKNWECIKSYWLQADAHCACMLSHFNRVLLFVTLWTIACQAPLSMGFSRQEYWSGLPCPPPGDLPNPGNGNGSSQPMSPESPALQPNSLLLSHLGSPNSTYPKIFRPLTILHREDRVLNNYPSNVVK